MVITAQQQCDTLPVWSQACLSAACGNCATPQICSGVFKVKEVKEPSFEAARRAGGVLQTHQLLIEPKPL